MFQRIFHGMIVFKLQKTHGTLLVLEKEQELATISIVPLLVKRGLVDGITLRSRFAIAGIDQTKPRVSLKDWRSF